MRYFECHITIEPVFNEDLETFKKICKEHNFKVADLLMQKDRKSTPERSNKDTFCTGHGRTYQDIYARMMDLVRDIKISGFQVWRYKIEDVILDIKLDKRALAWNGR